MSPKMEEKVIFDLPGVCARFVDDTGAESSVAGVLTILEKIKARCVFIEWSPFECVSQSKNATKTSGRQEFSVDLKDLRSFLLENKDSDSDASVKLLAKDGSNFPPLLFTMGGCGDFVSILQNFCMLKRSTKEPNLMLICDEKTEALQQSVSVLFKDNSQDFLSKIWSNPYAAAVTGLGKVTNYLQDHVLPNLLLDDFEKLDAEEQKYAVKSFLELNKNDALLYNNDVDAENLRIHHADGFEIVQYPLPKRPMLSRDDPLTLEEWQSFITPSGSMDRVETLKQRIFRGGIEPEVRKYAWKFLLNIYSWESTELERENILHEKRDYYYRMKLQWKTISEDQQSRFGEFRDRAALIDKDVTRTDRKHEFFEGESNQNLSILRDVLVTYVMYNFDLGYVQGMSDLLSPLMVVMENEVDSFWAFVGFMEKVRSNFELDQKAIKNQLFQLRDLLRVVNPALANHLESHDSDNMYFCFRWILVLFKREFSFSDISVLWEILWTDLPCKNFHLLMCLAILDSQKDMIIENKFGFTEVLKHINDLSMRLNLKQILISAEGIYHQLAASRENLPSYVCDYLGIQVLDLGTPNSKKIDQWTKQAKPKSGPAPGSVRRVENNVNDR